MYTCVNMCLWACVQVCVGVCGYVWECASVFGCVSLEVGNYMPRDNLYYFENVLKCD